MSSMAGRKYQRIDKSIAHIDKNPNKVLSIHPIHRFCWHKWKNPYHIHLGYSIARLYQSINTKLHNDIA